MTLQEAIATLSDRITGISPDATIKVQRRSDDEAVLRVYAPAEHEGDLRTATQDYSLELLTKENLDVQVLVYDIATSLPTE